ncbi:YbjN domain-containing protein [Kiloniella laminariae]|uniref:YbjN domain-containing protein n=1 Tax=Kiloniella laminariae TaxID=454162 RepID=UPI000366BE08|nr:YbjN domain-containing protein [Kiloniella laminariae]
MNSDATSELLPFNPIDVIEEWVLDCNWDFERESDFELMVVIDGIWCPLHLHFQWQSELEAMFFACHGEVEIPQEVYSQICELLMNVNNQLWLGHFDLIPETGSPAFRHTVPLRGQQAFNGDLTEDLVATALAEWDRLVPAIQLVCAGDAVESAGVDLALMEVAGEA